MKKNYKSILLLVSLLFFFILFFLYSQMVVEEILFYTKLFYFKVFPTSFLFLLLSYLLIENHLFYYLEPYFPNHGLYFFIISLISGYPAGIISVKEAYSRGEICLEEANQMIQFSHFPNPLFVIYQCQLLFSNPFMPYLFYGIIILSQFIIYLFIPKKRGSITSSNSLSSFQISLTKTMKTLLLIYGTSIFFYLISTFFTHSFSFTSIIYVFISGVFDLTNGIYSSMILSSTSIQIILLYFFIVFGSIPIHLQIKSILSDTSISYYSFLKGRILSFLLCVLLWFLIYRTCAIGIC